MAFGYGCRDSALPYTGMMAEYEILCPTRAFRILTLAFA
jgi:hypothetical protein